MQIALNPSKNLHFSPFCCSFCRPFQVDAPRDATLSVGEMLKRLQEHVLSPVGQGVLAMEPTEPTQPEPMES